MSRLTTRTDAQAAYALQLGADQRARRQRKRRTRRGGLADPRNAWVAIAAAGAGLLLALAAGGA